MAGLGRKVFNAGEVLSAANVQGYLQDQVVQVYSGTAARSSALGTAVSEGMMSYLTDANELSVYTSNGTAAWSPVNLQQSGNAVINGAFDYWQRGTSFTPANGSYSADRFQTNFDGTGSTRAISQQTFTPGTAPVAGYEGQYFFRYAQTVAGTGGTYNNIFDHYVEDVRNFAGQTVTYSFWAKAAVAASFTMGIVQNFGSGGSGTVSAGSQSISVTTSWQRFSFTVAMPSISGKTIGSASKLDVYLQASPNTTFTIDIWGVQLEAGSVATPFRRSSPTLQGELAACQRYYWRNTVTGAGRYGSGSASSTTQVVTFQQFPVEMRVPPTSVEYSSVVLGDNVNANITATSLAMYDQSKQTCMFAVGAASGLTQYRTYVALSSAGGYIGVSAEL